MEEEKNPEIVRKGMCVSWCVCVCAFRGVWVGGSPCLSEPKNGTCYLFLILPALCGFAAVTDLRVETGTNEQLHPACLPGIMGLQTGQASVCALFLHSHFVIPSLPCVHLISNFRLLPFSGSIIVFFIFLFPRTITHSLFLILLTLII